MLSSSVFNHALAPVSLPIFFITPYLVCLLLPRPQFCFFLCKCKCRFFLFFFFLLGRDYLICLLQNEVPKQTPCGYNYIIFRRPQKKKKNKNNESPFFWIGLVFLDANLAATVLDSGDHSFLMKQKRDICSCFCFASFFFWASSIYTNKFLGQQWILMSASVSVKFVCS
uniref:Uncharacterized protein n=1 Tax=Populus trichocarpa TaxID=3694 RepID=A0A2K1YTD3_POPTR